MSDIHTNLLQEAVERRKQTEGYSLLFGVLDNDPKGLTGVGTIFYAKGLLNHEQIELTWSLIDEINNSLSFKDWCNFRNEYLQKCDQFFTEESDRIKDEKAQKLNERLNSVSVSDRVLEIIKTTIEQEQVLIQQYKEGKEKPFNSVVGKIIKQTKSEGISEEVFNIVQVLKSLI